MTIRTHQSEADRVVMVSSTGRLKVQVVSHGPGKSNRPSRHRVRGLQIRVREEVPAVKVTFKSLTEIESDATTRLGTKEHGDVLGIPTSVTNDQLADFFEPLGELTGMQKDYRLYDKKIWADTGVRTFPTTPKSS